MAISHRKSPITSKVPHSVLHDEESLKYLRDLKNSERTAREEGRLEGLAEGKLEEKRDIARNLLDVLDDETIAQKTGMSLEKIQELRKL